jgi:hypothetical protein
MSIEAILDTIIHVDKFKTFDMLSQGTYRLKMRLYHIQDQQVPRSQFYLTYPKENIRTTLSLPGKAILLQENPAAAQGPDN